MNRLDVGILGHADDLIDVQVGADGRRLDGFIEHVRLVGPPAVLIVSILVAVDGDRPDVQFRARSHDADGDFGAIRGHDLGEGRRDGVSEEGELGGEIIVDVVGRIVRGRGRRDVGLGRDGHAGGGGRCSLALTIAAARRHGGPAVGQRSGAERLRDMKGRRRAGEREDGPQRRLGIAQHGCSRVKRIKLSYTYSSCEKKGSLDLLRMYVSSLLPAQRYLSWVKK
mmetsp:Transcript_18871/g.54646  ORF Transcript_18871/g.54646 Transcript_18871/m.54646 type:complete len:225 (-) Transcript_18871:88-762(-)